MLELATLRFNNEDFTQGFYATFNKQVGKLHQGDEIYLQLPNSPDCQHDDNYDDDTISSCIDIIGKKYSDEDLSVMNIIKSCNIYSVDIKDTVVRFLDDEGVERCSNTHILRLKDDDVFLLVDISALHRYYTGNKAWEVDKELDSRFTDEEKIAIYEKAGDKAY